MVDASVPSWVTRRRALLFAVVVGLALSMAWVMQPTPVPVEIAAVVSGPLQVTLDEDGETRVLERYIVSAPVAGRLQRIDLEPGAPVVAETTVVATLLPAASGLIDDRTRTQLQTRVAAAQAALSAARGEEARVRVQCAQADRDLARARELAAAGAVSRERLETTEVTAETLRRGLEVAREHVRGAEADVRLARASLATPSPGSRRAPVQVRSPITGVVLRRLHESEAVVPQGEPLLEIADIAQLEVVADFLSTDAVRMRPGQRAVIERWGGGDPIRGRVRRVEPAGFTKVSALGVEEQRVNVVIAIEEAPRTAPLGDRFRVEARVVIWEAPSVTRVPIGSLVRDGVGWSVFAVRAERAIHTPVTIGQRNALEAQVLSGVTPGDLVIVFPGSAIADGVKVIDDGDR